MEGSDRELIDRLAWLFNHMLEEDDTPYRAEAQRVWAEEPEIVPMRAALEGNLYSGPNAVEDFRAESMESWAELEIELLEVIGTGPRYLAAGALRGRGRESGAEIQAPVWTVVDVVDGRVTRAAGHLDRDTALAEFAEGG